MKSTDLAVQKRVEEVFKLRLGGAEFHDIRDYANAPEQSDGNGRHGPPWNVSDSQIRRYINRADELCKERFDARADHYLARHILQRRTLYAHAMAAGDLRTALAVLRDEAELERLYPAGKVELTGKDGAPLPIAFIEVSIPLNPPVSLPALSLQELNDVNDAVGPVLDRAD